MDHRYKKFLAVAETGSFSAAAKRLRVTQPAITLAVGSLERAFGVRLYKRKKYAIELTKEGEIVARYAKKMMQEFEKMKTELTGNTNTKKLSIGIIDSLAHLLYTSSDIFVKSNIEVMVDNSKRIINDLTDGKIDLGVITGQPDKLNKDIIVHKLKNEEFVFVCAPNMAPNKPVTYIDNWLAFNKDSTSYKHFVRLFKKQGLKVAPVFYSTSMELLKDMAVAGKGTALLPKHIIQDSIINGILSVVDTKPLYRPIWAVSKTTVNTDVDITNSINRLLSPN
ncbi:MAG: LysR family transcriptional regulator [Patescibacteria group bacterium]|jgi:DNA-binding transcriptional LysR family regulator|nr:LysR family transcriptional regulator [Patescibacteria group bacterium]